MGPEAMILVFIHVAIYESVDVYILSKWKSSFTNIVETLVLLVGIQWLKLLKANLLIVNIRMNLNFVCCNDYFFEYSTQVLPLPDYFFRWTF